MKRKDELKTILPSRIATNPFKPPVGPKQQRKSSPLGHHQTNVRTNAK
jgi:hypothetical protein